jgi:hypothetical protein
LGLPDGRFKRAAGKSRTPSQRGEAVPRWVWGSLVLECLAVLVWAWSKQVRNLPLRP